MIHYYNPENDLCLASGLTNYTPPRAAQRLRDAGAMLPLWYGSSGDSVLSYGVNARWYDQMVNDFDIPVRLWDHNPDGCVPSPWGWSLPVRKYFISLGFSTESMPSEKQILTLRQLSHRRTALQIARNLYDQFPIVEPGKECFNPEEVESLYRQWGEIMVKFPWSSSGRGLANSRLMGIDKTLRMARESIAKQGSVVVERSLSPILDFALLYECNGSSVNFEGSCNFIGTSVFNTDIRGIYTGNVLGSEEYLQSLISKHYDLGQLSAICESLRVDIERVIASHYTGILGADMLITTDAQLALVEINLRKTMGYVAHRFSQRYLHPESSGTMSIVQLHSPSLSFSDKSLSNKIISSHCLLSGSLSLTPSNSDLSFLVQAQHR